MQTLTAILSSAEFWSIALPALVAIGAWFLNERSKLQWGQYKRKEENDKELLRCLKGCYVSTQDRELKNQLLHQVSLRWLYAPDPVIRIGYACLDKVKTRVSASDRAKELACGALVAAVERTSWRFAKKLQDTPFLSRSVPDVSSHLRADASQQTGLHHGFDR
jgi:hypothetical protein